jgi:hypothetical protein
MHLRFIVQPIMAAILGIRAGIHDGRQATPPSFGAYARNRRAGSDSSSRQVSTW